MALSSWLQQASSSFLNFPTEHHDGRHEHELPHLYRNNSISSKSSAKNSNRKMSPSFSPSPPVSPPPPPRPTIPPAPVTASVHASTVRLKQTRALPDTMLLLRRREKQLHAELQDLLDAQEEALSRESIGGDAGQEGDDMGLSSGSLTPTVQSLTASKGKALDQQQSPRRSRNRNIGIGSARKGIRKAMRQLAAVKDEEGYLLDANKAKNTAVLEKLATWEEQRGGLEKQIQDIEEQSNEGSRTEALREEAHTLEGEIQELEQKLRDMKTKHRSLVTEISDIENAVQSKLSSYKTSLSLLEADISTFLQSKRSRSPDASKFPEAAPFYSIHPKRRTLSMAKEHFQDALSTLSEQQTAIETERAALDEGALMWTEIVHTVSDFERKIAAATQAHAADAVAEAKHLLAELERTIAAVDARHEAAQDKGWTLLVCCIGAELSALHQGRGILEVMLKAAGGGAGDGAGSKAAPEGESDVDVAFRPSMGGDSASASGEGEGEGESEAGEGSAETRKQISSVRQVRHEYHTDEDEPDPELLISHQDTDDD